MADDEFMEIIQNSNLGDFSDIELNHMSVKDLHIGLKYMSQAMVILTDFIYEFLSSFESEDDEHPGLSSAAIMHTKDMFDSSRKFCQEFYDDEEDNDEDFEEDLEIDDDDTSEEDE